MVILVLNFYMCGEAIYLNEHINFHFYVKVNFSHTHVLYSILSCIDRH